MDLDPPFCKKKNVIFVSILANFGPKISSPDPKYNFDWYKTIEWRSTDTGKTLLTDLIDN